MLDAAQGIPLSKRWHKAPVGLAVEPWPHLEGCSNLAVTPLARAVLH